MEIEQREKEGGFVVERERTSNGESREEMNIRWRKSEGTSNGEIAESGDIKWRKTAEREG